MNSVIELLTNRLEAERESMTHALVNLNAAQNVVARTKQRIDDLRAALDKLEEDKE